MLVCATTRCTRSRLPFTVAISPPTVAGLPEGPRPPQGADAGTASYMHHSPKASLEAQGSFPLLSLDRIHFPTSFPGRHSLSFSSLGQAQRLAVLLDAHFIFPAGLGGCPPRCTDHSRNSPPFKAPDLLLCQLLCFQSPSAKISLVRCFAAFINYVRCI